MTNVSLGKKRFARGAVALFLVFLGFFTSPGFAAASTLLPLQVIPPATGKSCPAVTFSEIQAHVYSGSLDSFDITLSDASYVAVFTAVGEEIVGLNYVTRWHNADGSVRTHVDLQPTMMDKDLRIEMTFLSTRIDEGGRQVTCAFTVPALLPAETETSGPVSGSGSQTPHTSSPTVTPDRGGQTGSGTTSGTTTATSSNPGLVSAMSSLGNLCVNGGATKLWVVLLILFALFVFTLCAQRFEAASSSRDWNIGLILAVFVGLLIFWYASAACRTGPWAPAIATFITIVGLLYTMLKGDHTQEILLLKDGEK